MPFCVLLAGMLRGGSPSDSACNSSSLEENTCDLFEAFTGLLEALVEAFVDRETDEPIVVVGDCCEAGEGFAAGEKLSFVCRLRCALFGAMVASLYTELFVFLCLTISLDFLDCAKVASSNAPKNRHTFRKRNKAWVYAYCMQDR